MHVLLCGVTLSGKTTLARALARSFAEVGQRVVVYDPVGTATAGGGWPASAIVIDDPDIFSDYMMLPEVRGAHVFIDEADEILSLRHDYNFWMLKKGRHFGLHCYLMTQRPKMVAPNARKMCGRVYMFRLAVDDAREIGADYGFSNVHKIFLDTGDFLVLDSGQASIKRANIFKLLEGQAP